MTCPNCTKDAPEGASDCPHCGVIFAKLVAARERREAPASAPPRRSGGGGIPLGAVAVAALAAFGAWRWIGGGPGKSPRTVKPTVAEALEAKHSLAKAEFAKTAALERKDRLLAAPPAEPGPVTGPKCEFTGIVYDLTTGLPIKGASVTFGPYKAVSDSSGAFLLEVQAKDGFCSAYAWVRHPDYDSRYQFEGDFRTLPLERRLRMTAGIPFQGPTKIPEGATARKEWALFSFERLTDEQRDLYSKATSAP